MLVADTLASVVFCPATTSFLASGLPRGKVKSRQHASRPSKGQQKITPRNHWPTSFRSAVVVFVNIVANSRRPHFLAIDAYKSIALGKLYRSRGRGESTGESFGRSGRRRLLYPKYGTVRILGERKGHSYKWIQGTPFAR